MGIYLQGYGALEERETNNLALRLIDAARHWAAEQGLQDLFHATPTDAGAWLTFYPPAGGIEFEIDGASVAFGVKTSIAGPGYHAAIIALCDHLGSELGIAWRWDSGSDETGFATERDFHELREVFLDQVAAFGKFHRDDVDPGEGHVINLAEGLVMDGVEGVATPLGPLPIRLFLDAAESREGCETLAQRIFPWWSQERNQEFWINTLRAILWTEVEWRGARTPWESHVHGAALAMGDRLRAHLDAPLGAAIAELASLSGHGEGSSPPSDEGIGYLRRTRAFFVGGGWRVNLPGYYIEEIEDDGNTICIWFGDEEIRASSFIVSPKDGQTRHALAWDEHLSGQPDQYGVGFNYRCDPVAQVSASCPGYSSARAEFQTLDAQGNSNLLILSIFGPGHDLAARLKEIAGRVWLQQPSTNVGDHAN